MKPFNKKFNFFLLLIFAMSLLLFTALSCDSAEPFNQKTFQFSVLETSCTEAWLKVISNDSETPKLKIKNGEQIIFDGILSTTDTIIYTDSLLPSTNYSLTAEMDGSNYKTTSTTQFRTLDTTSHDFTWQTFTFGEHASSVLFDVAIIDENNIWAVGQIFLNDSTGNPDPHVYNAVHWDGVKWEYKRLYYTAEGNNSIGPLNAVYAFSPNNIWFGVGNIIQWDGEKLNSIKIGLGITINKIWGTSSDDLYVVGDYGNIARYDGISWQMLESGTELPIQDVRGAYNEETKNNEVMCVASDKYYGGGPELFVIQVDKVIPQAVEGLSWSVSSIWFKNNYKTYIAGDGIYIKTEGKTDQEWKDIIDGITTYYMHSISGNGLNDVFLSGSGGEMVHFNGSTWKNYTDENVSGFYGNLYRITAKDNIVCSVGSGHINGQQAVIVLGKR